MMELGWSMSKTVFFSIGSLAILLLDSNKNRVQSETDNLNSDSSFPGKNVGCFRRLISN